MTNEVECPFNEPIPAGRQTMEVPFEVRQELAELIRQHRVFSGIKLSRDPSRRDETESFGAYYRSSSALTSRLNEIERTILGRPKQARIAFHDDWKYSIETVEVLARELQNEQATQIGP